MKLKDLGMTEEQAVYEILFMRDWDAFLHDQIGEKKYTEYGDKYNRLRAEKQMQMMGIPEEEIKRCCDAVDREMERERNARS